MGYIPQAQWEMFVTDSQKIYFVSASVLQGTNVFVVDRDDAYIELMVRVIDHFFREFVLTGIEPSNNFFWGQPDYMELMSQTRNISGSVAVTIRIPPQVC